MTATSKTTKPVEPTANVQIAESIEAETSTQAYAQFQAIKVLMLVGQPYGGKSLMAQALYDIADLKNRDDVFAGDCEEGSNKVFLRCNPEKIQATKIETVEDIDKIVEDLDKDGYSYALLDLQGSAQRPVQNAFGDFKHLSRMSVAVVPIIMVGTRDGAEKVAKEWVEIFKHLPKIYWIWNNQNVGTQDTRELPTSLACGREKIIEIHIPPIRQQTAEEIIRVGAPLSKVASRSLADSPQLSTRFATLEIIEWRRDLLGALAPVIDEFH